MATPYGEPHTELVVLENVIGHVCVERLQHGHSSITVVVDVVSWGNKNGCDIKIGRETKTTVHGSIVRPWHVNNVLSSTNIPAVVG